MNIINERVEKIEKLIKEIKNHCMCLTFEDDGAYYRVIYPDGDYFTNGAQINYRVWGKIDALERLLKAIEKAWKDSLLF